MSLDKENLDFEMDEDDQIGRALALSAPIDEETDEDTEETQQRQPSKQSHSPREADNMSILMTILTDMQKNQREILAKQKEMSNMLSTMNTQLMADRQRINNLELRVETLQQSRVMSLTHQPITSSMTAPSSGPTPHLSPDEELGQLII